MRGGGKKGNRSYLNVTGKRGEVRADFFPRLRGEGFQEVTGAILSSKSQRGKQTQKKKAARLPLCADRGLLEPPYRRKWEYRGREKKEATLWSSASIKEREGTRVSIPLCKRRSEEGVVLGKRGNRNTFI